MFKIGTALLLFISFLTIGNHVYAEANTFQKPQQLIPSFLSGLQAESPKQTIELWILGVKNRSGAVQYATLSPYLQEKSKNQFEEKGWGTGQSSPWADKFSIVKEEKIDGFKKQYTIEYGLYGSNWAWDKKGEKIITVEKNPKRAKTWYITQIKTKYNEYEAFTPAETVIR